MAVLCHDDNDPQTWMACTGNCNQGRACTCQPEPASMCSALGMEADQVSRGSRIGLLLCIASALVVICALGALWGAS